MANGNSLFVLFCLVLQGDVTIQAKSQFFYVQLRSIHVWILNIHVYRFDVILKLIDHRGVLNFQPV